MAEIFDIDAKRAENTIIDSPEAFADLISGFSSHNTDPSRPFTGQAHTDQGERGKTEVCGIRFRDLSDCMVKAMAYCAGGEFYDKAENNTLSYNDVYSMKLEDIDPLALAQNLTCEVEKMMGIYPNVPSLKETD